jgi:hypothetical protein
MLGSGGGAETAQGKTAGGGLARGVAIGEVPFEHQWTEVHVTPDLFLRWQIADRRVRSVFADR